MSGVGGCGWVWVGVGVGVVRGFRVEIIIEQWYILQHCLFPIHPLSSVCLVMDSLINSATYH